MSIPSLCIRAALSLPFLGAIAPAAHAAKAPANGAFGHPAQVAFDDAASSTFDGAAYVTIDDATRLAIDDATSLAIDETIDGLIARGRAELEAGRPEAAQKLFEEAAAKDSNSLRTRVWVLRSWIAQGRINDALNATDEIAKSGAKGPELDYLYGTAFALIARKHIEQQNGSGLVDMNLKDAVSFLEKATKADPERFSDAFVLLAESAWHAQDLDVARAAADKACALQPKSADSALMLGRIALAQFMASAGDDAKKTAADKDWETARSSFQRAAELLASAKDPAQRTTLAKIHIDLGHAYKWKEKVDEAAKEYGQALGLDPAIANFQQLLGALGPERFLAALEAGAKAFAANGAAEGKADAGLLWWLGWARFEAKDYAKADEAFSAAVKKEPSFFNSWYYIALARYHQKNYDGAIAALRRNHDENAPDLSNSIQSNADLNLRILDYLVGYCAQKQQNLEAAILSEIQATAVPTNADYWNNAGLFYRDAGVALRQAENPEDAKTIKEYFEKAYSAYSKALELTPDNPALMNDTAVMLHYYLDRDPEKAKSLYKKAAERAEAELKREDLKPDVRDLYKTALRDSKNNLAKLERGEKKEG